LYYSGLSHDDEVQMPRISKARLTADRLRELARTGAEITLQRLRSEITALEKAFPELANPDGREAMRQSVRTAATRTRTMSVAARKAVSARMKRYWAERRKEQAKVKRSAG
jgi:hypothetical protein